MSLLDDVSIVVTPNGYKAGELYAVKPTFALGSELVTNSIFNSDNTSDWGNGFYDSFTFDSSEGGYYNLQRVTTDSRTNINLSSVLTVGKRYKVTVVARGSGGIKTGLTTVGYTTQPSAVFTLTSSFASYSTIVTVTSGLVYGVLWNDDANSNIDYQSYSVKEYISADMDVTRATDATRVDENGLIEDVLSNVPRIDYTGGGCPHILAEPQRTNLITYSEDYTSGWIPYQASVNTNEVISPDGSLNADKIIENTANSTHFVAPIVNNIPSSGTATLSVFAKKGENNWIKLVQYTNYVNFDLNNGVVGNSSAISSSIINYGNGWYKCIMNFNIGGSGANVDFKLGENNTSNWDDIYTGDGTSGVYIYGAQLEVGSYATSYIPTSGSTVTRNQDIFTRDGIGSLINSTEGVLFVEIAALTSLVPLNNWLTITDGTASNQVAIGFETNAKTTVRVDVGGVLQAYITVSGDYSQNRKLAFKWKENDFALWIDGVEVGVDTSGATLSSGTLNSLQFNWGAGGNYTNAKVKQLQVYDTSLSDTQLAALTT